MTDDVRRGPDAELRFGHDLRAAREARRLVGELLSDDDERVASSVELVVSELVTNVVIHTHDGGMLRAWDAKQDAPVRIEVEDPDPGMPEIPADERPVGGRGLRIVAASADGWGVAPTDGGKVVWAEFDRTGATRVRAPEADGPADHRSTGR